MAEPDPDVFDLLIERGDAGYRARVLNSPAGNAAADLGPPISEHQLESFLFKVGRPRRVARRGGSRIENEVRTFGEQLFEFLFPSSLRASLQTNLMAARMRGTGLRIQIRLSDVPELADLPWEFLYEREANHFCLSTHTPVVRFLEMPQPLVSMRVTPPLRVLVVISSSMDYPRLDVDREWAKLAEATEGAASKGLLRLERLETARLARLNRLLRSADYHVLHFIGHGNFDEEEGAGELHFEDERGRAAHVTANQLAAALRDHRSLRLVVLNACEGARASRRDPFAGTAQTLIANGLPAVVAMQFEITDEAAITFASEFYSFLAMGDPIDKALSEARKGIFFDGNPLEWATPVLYLRAGNGRIFDVPKSEPAERLRAEQIASRETHQQGARREAAQREAEEKARREAAQREAERDNLRRNSTRGDAREKVVDLELGDGSFTIERRNPTHDAPWENRLTLFLKNGPVTIQPLPDLAPRHVERIKTLARQGFYDGTPFHRVIEGFMAQTGDPTGTGTGGSDLPDLPAEFTSGYRFIRGTCGMARTGDPNSANSQFFIMFASAPSLDNQYTIWGRVESGMEAVDKIKRGDPARNGLVQDPDRLLRARIWADMR